MMIDEYQLGKILKDHRELSNPVLVGSLFFFVNQEFFNSSPADGRSEGSIANIFAIMSEA